MASIGNVRLALGGPRQDSYRLREEPSLGRLRLSYIRRRMPPKTNLNQLGVSRLRGPYEVSPVHEAQAIPPTFGSCHSSHHSHLGDPVPLLAISRNSGSPKSRPTTSTIIYASRLLSFRMLSPRGHHCEAWALATLHEIYPPGKVVVLPPLP